MAANVSAHGRYPRTPAAVVVAAALALAGCAGPAQPAAGSAQAPVATTQPTTASAAPSATSAAGEESKQTWVGPVPGTQANIAIQTFEDGRAQAYVCDGGGLVSVLFKGRQAANGGLSLVGPDGETVVATPRRAGVV